MTPPIYTREQAKAYARQIRAEHAANNRPISHSAALEYVAKELGYADWNTLSARLSNVPERPFQVGDRIVGQYLHQPVKGCVLGVREMAGGASFDVTIEFDEPVNVVTFESFSNFRQRVQLTLSKDGTSYTKTSDGVPHLIVAHESACDIV